MSDDERGFWGAHPSPPSRTVSDSPPAPFPAPGAGTMPPCGTLCSQPFIPPVGMESCGSPRSPGGPLPGRTAPAARLGAVPDGALPAAPTPAVALSPAGPGCPVRRGGGDTSSGLGTALPGNTAALPWRRALAAAGQCWVAEEGVKEPGGHADTFFGI